LNNEALHVAQHLTFILSAILFWSAVMRRDARRSGQGGAIMALFLSSLQAGLLGALLTFSNKVWYPNAADPFPICGLTRAEDQALAGLVMWVPACTIYIVVALIMAARWLALLQTRHA
jgi:cytochrome c oxidase assembly factor CtaG